MKPAEPGAWNAINAVFVAKTVNQRVRCVTHSHTNDSNSMQHNGNVIVHTHTHTLYVVSNNVQAVFSNKHVFILSKLSGRIFVQISVVYTYEYQEYCTSQSGKSASYCVPNSCARFRTADTTVAEYKQTVTETNIV